MWKTWRTFWRKVFRLDIKGDTGLKMFFYVYSIGVFLFVMFKVEMLRSVPFKTKRTVLHLKSTTGRA